MSSQWEGFLNIFKGRDLTQGLHMMDMSVIGMDYFGVSVGLGCNCQFGLWTQRSVFTSLLGVESYIFFTLFKNKETWTVHGYCWMFLWPDVFTLAFETQHNVLRFYHVWITGDITARLLLGSTLSWMCSKSVRTLVKCIKIIYMHNVYCINIPRTTHSGN